MIIEVNCRIGGGVLAEQLHHEGAERAGAPGGRLRFGGQHGLEGGRGVRAAVRGHPLDRRVQHDPQRPQVRLRPGALPEDPLGCDVLGRADERAGLGELLLALDLRDPEVGEHDPVAGAEHDVVRLDVPVQDADRVGGRQRVEDREADPGRLAGVQGAFLEAVAERRAAHQLHDDPRLAVLDHHVVDGDDGGVVDPGCGPRLAPHALVHGAVFALAEVVRYARLLHGHLAVDDLVVGPPDRAHPAVPEPRDQPVAPADQPVRRPVRGARRSGRRNRGARGSGRGGDMRRGRGMRCAEPARSVRWLESVAGGLVGPSPVICHGPHPGSRAGPGTTGDGQRVRSRDRTATRAGHGALRPGPVGRLGRWTARAHCCAFGARQLRSMMSNFSRLASQPSCGAVR
ncbi:hypothetical protein P376_5825 [Streptomyces sp. HCCB10043]|nr:hypothetical protein P376_5825 [Streptomyces sp. HCCB10043]